MCNPIRHGELNEGQFAIYFRGELLSSVLLVRMNGALHRCRTLTGPYEPCGDIPPDVTVFPLEQSIGNIEWRRPKNKALAYAA